MPLETELENDSPDGGDVQSHAHSAQEALAILWYPVSMYVTCSALCHGPRGTLLPAWASLGASSRCTAFCREVSSKGDGQRTKTHKDTSCRPRQKGTSCSYFGILADRNGRKCV